MQETIMHGATVIVEKYCKVRTNFDALITQSGFAKVNPEPEYSQELESRVL